MRPGLSATIASGLPTGANRTELLVRRGLFLRLIQALSASYALVNSAARQSGICSDLAPRFLAAANLDIVCHMRVLLSFAVVGESIEVGLTLQAQRPCDRLDRIGRFH